MMTKLKKLTVKYFEGRLERSTSAFVGSIGGLVAMVHTSYLTGAGAEIFVANRLAAVIFQGKAPDLDPSVLVNQLGEGDASLYWYYGMPGDTSRSCSYRFTLEPITDRDIRHYPCWYVLPNEEGATFAA
jgi:hypothetical protein